MNVLRQSWIILLAVTTPFLADRSAAQAQPKDLSDRDSSGLSVEAAAGWDGVVDTHGPIPVALLLNNYSDGIIEGEVRLSDPYRGDEILLEQIVLAPGTARRVASVQALPNWYRCYASLTHDGKVLWRRELNLQTGRSFNSRLNTVLFVTGDGRALPIGITSTNSTIGPGQSPVVAGLDGRPVQCLGVRPWQLPDHHGALAVAQAIIMPESVTRDQLNNGQWQAIANWVCEGGHLLIHQSATEIEERLLKNAPLPAIRLEPVDGRTVTAIGLGSLQRFAPDVLSSESAELLASLESFVADLPHEHPVRRLQLDSWYGSHGGNADMNRALVLSFFALYAALSGGVSLLLFRAQKRTVGIFLLTVVGGSCLLTATLGAMIRTSSGDLHSVSITCVGQDGGVQLQHMRLLSAGARSTQATIQAPNPDLQLLQNNSHRYYYGWHEQRGGYPAFTRRANLLAAEDDRFQVDIPMTPWGRSDLLATSFIPDLKPLRIGLEWSSNEPPGDLPSDTSIPGGRMRVQIESRLPFALEDPWLVIGTARMESNTLSAPVPPPWQQTEGPTTPGGYVDLYHFESLPAIPAGDTAETEFVVNLRTQADSEFHRHWNGGSIRLPRIATIGRPSAWIVARVSRSPAVKIDRSATDFIPLTELHVFLQTIEAVQLPAELTLPAQADETAAP